MSLVVETGAGLIEAESYAGVATLRAYCAARGIALPDDDDLAEQALRRATEALDGLYRDRWAGYAATPGQALCWPRAYAPLSGRYGFLPSDALPPALVRATCACAVREIEAPGSLAPDIEPGVRVTQESVGPLSVNYADDGTGSAGPPVLVGVMRLVEPLLRTGGVLVVRA